MCAVTFGNLSTELFKRLQSVLKSSKFVLFYLQRSVSLHPCTSEVDTLLQNPVQTRNFSLFALLKKNDFPRKSERHSPIQQNPAHTLAMHFGRCCCLSLTLFPPAMGTVKYCYKTVSLGYYLFITGNMACASLFYCNFRFLRFLRLSLF